MKKVFFLTLGLLFVFASTGLSQNQFIAEELNANRAVHPTTNLDFISKLSDSPAGFEYQDYVEDADFFKVDKEAYQLFLEDKPQVIELSILTEIGPLDLILFQKDILSGQYLLRTSTGMTLPRRDDQLFFRGIIKGKPNTMVTASFYENDMDIAVFSEVIFRFDQVKLGIYSGYLEEDILNQPEPFVCHTEDDHDEHDDPAITSVEDRDPQSGDCIQIYVECDYEKYLDHGSSVTNTENFVTSLYNEVATQYSNEQIPLSISEIKVWDTTDPYLSGLSTGDVLDLFGQQVQNSHETNGGRLATLLSGRSLGGGIAWVDVLCSQYNSSNHAGPYNVCASIGTSVTPYPTYTWNLNVVSHEMGHNIGLRHTHRCHWDVNNDGNADEQIDDCGNVWADVNGYTIEGAACYDDQNPIIPTYGTVMSYCHINASTSSGIDPALGFGTLPGNAMRDFYNNASCNTGTGCSPLPVEIVSFEAEKKGVKALLNWETESERNNMGFEVLRSVDGQKWTSIGWVNSIENGSSFGQYLFDDDFPALGVNYYKLKQIDFDGRYDFSDVRSVEFNKKSHPITLVPNPTQGDIRFSFVPESGAFVRIFNELGQLVLAIDIDPTAVIGLSDLPKGMYFVQVETIGSIEHIKLLKTN